MTCALCAAFDQKWRLVADNGSCFAVICKAPLKRGHIIVMPKRHLLNLDEFTQEETNDFLDLIEEIKDALQKGFDEDPIVFQNTGRHATQEHVHYHVLPSKGGLRQFVGMFEGVPERKDVSDEVMINMRDEVKSYM